MAGHLAAGNAPLVPVPSALALDRASPDWTRRSQPACVGMLRGDQPVALDCGMQPDQVNLRVRCAPLYYSIHRMGLGEDSSGRAPEQQDIVQLNSNQIDSERASEDEREPA